MKINYDHSQNLHTQKGPIALIPELFQEAIPQNILDVGCGEGTWLRAASEYGVSEVFGIDGVEIAPEHLLFKNECFRRADLTKPIDLGRRFEMVLCLEVAEHLDNQYSETLIKTLTTHGDTVVFSAACPGQPGQHHVNCEWPEYWQNLFNKFGYVCDDEIRWRIWCISSAEPWYKQNMMVARYSPEIAGKEARIKPVIHPEMILSIRAMIEREAINKYHRHIKEGRLPWSSYPILPFSALFYKLQRILGVKKP